MRVLIYICGSDNTTNTTCASATEIKNVFKNSTLYVLGLQPPKYDFKASKPLGMGANTAVTYRYTVTPNQTSTSSLYVFPT